MFYRLRPHTFLLSLLVSMSLSQSGSAKTERYQLDQFIVDLNIATDDDLPKIVIFHKGKPNFPVWATSNTTNRGFFQAFAAKEQVKNSRASFSFSRQIEESCLQQKIGKITTEKKRLIIEGYYEDCSNLGYEFHIISPATDELAFQAFLKDDFNRYNHVSLTYQTDDSELFYGFGEQYFDYNAKGKILPIWLQEQGHGRGLQPITSAMKLIGTGPSAGNWSSTYSAIPSYLTNKGRGLCLDNTEYLEFDLRESTEVTVNVWNPEISGRIFYGPTPLESLEQLTSYSGRMIPIPEWTQKGIILRVYGGEDKVLEAVNKAEQVGLKVAGVWIEDWVGHRSTLIAERLWWNWEPAKNLYPNWPELVAQLNQRDVKVLIYFNPYLSDVSHSEHTFQRNLFAEAMDQDYFVRERNGKFAKVKAGLFTGNMIDLTNPDAREFLKALMKKQLEIGVSGWMADFGEAIPYSAIMHSGQKGRSYHNIYATEWAKLSSEAIREAGLEGKAFAFHRSGSLKSPRYNSMFWTGDQIANWDKFDGLGTIVPALTSAGLSGWALSHSDIGGFMAADFVVFSYKRSQELLIRWLELNTFTSLLRTHTSNQPKLSHQWDSNEKTSALFVKMNEVFRALWPYRKRLLNEAYSKGYPVVRHPILHFPHDSEVAKIRQQFMLGDSFWIAPTVEEGKDEVSTYLPEGKWTHLWTGKVYSSNGQYFNIYAPLGEPSVFYKSSSPEGNSVRQKLIRKGIISQIN